MSKQKCKKCGGSVRVLSCKTLLCKNPECRFVDIPKKMLKENKIVKQIEMAIDKGEEIIEEQDKKFRRLLK